MRRINGFLTFVTALSILVVGSAFADTEPMLQDNKDAEFWLKRIQGAAQKLNYSGTFVYQQADQIRTSRIAHLLDGRNEFEKLEIIDGKPREYIRRNEEVLCYVPDAKTVLVEKRDAHDTFPAMLASHPAEIKDYYSLRKAESGRVAGHECQAIMLEPKDKLRYGYKLWADASTGLLLRAQTLNEKSEVIEQISFTQISIGNVDRARTKASIQDTSGWRVENAVTSQAGPSRWTVSALPQGFRKIQEVNRQLSDLASRGHLKREVLQIVFSDGLAAISVFIEPGTQSRTEGSAQQGAMNIVGKRQGDYWITIVGDVPNAAIKQVANSIEFKTK